MKSKLSFFMLMLTSFLLTAQSPLQFNYQAVIRDSGGEPMSGQEAEISVYILQGSADGMPVLAETHQVITNDFGLVSLQIGSVASLEDVDWADGPYFIEVWVDGVQMGVSQLLSVPFSLHAMRSADAFSGQYEDLAGAPDLSGMVQVHDPQAGDLLYYGHDGWARLPIGQEGQVLMVSGGVPAWVSVDFDTEVTDADGNVYEALTIGQQQWLSTNLRARHYRNGDPINTDLDVAGWASATEGAFGIFPHADLVGLDSEEDVAAAYGLLYNWYAVNDERGLCPEGWRVPSQQDWAELIAFVQSDGYLADYGNALKSCRQDGSPLGEECNTAIHPRWFFNATNYGTDAYGFGALPGGYRHAVNGAFLVAGFGAYLWTSTEVSQTNAYYHSMLFAAGIIFPVESIEKQMGNSVRCVK